MRWQHPDRGLVAPGEFIEIAEENGAILPIGRWVLARGLPSAPRWQAAGSRRRASSCASTSRRARSSSPDFVGRRRGDAGRGRARADALSLEITETALLKATPSTIATLEALRALGVRVVIDDFGTGYFSLSHLRQFPVDALKIASEFVQVADGDSRSAALAGAIVAMSESLDDRDGRRGHRDTAQAERMRSLGCTYGQGYFFARPISEADLAEGIAGLVFGAGGSDAPAEAVEDCPTVRAADGAPALQPTLGLEPGQA